MNVTYDLLQGEFPPPSHGGLSVKIEEDEDLLSSQHPLGVDMSSVGQSLDNLCLGAEANYGSESSVAPSMNEKIDQVKTLQILIYADLVPSAKFRVQKCLFTIRPKLFRLG